MRLTLCGRALHLISYADMDTLIVNNLVPLSLFLPPAYGQNGPFMVISREEILDSSVEEALIHMGAG